MTTVTQSTWNRRKLAFAEAMGVDVCQATGIEREGEGGKSLVEELEAVAKAAANCIGGRQ